MTIDAYEVGLRQNEFCSDWNAGERGCCRMIPCAIPCRFAATPLYQGDSGRSKIDAP